MDERPLILPRQERERECETRAGQKTSQSSPSPPKHHVGVDTNRARPDQTRVGRPVCRACQTYHIGLSTRVFLLVVIELSSVCSQVAWSIQSTKGNLCRGEGEGWALLGTFVEAIVYFV